MGNLRYTERTRILQMVLFIAAVCGGTVAIQICPYDAQFEYEVFPQLQRPASVGNVHVSSLNKTCRCIFDTLTCSSLETIADLFTGADALNITSLNLWNGKITSVSKNSLPPGLKSIYFNNQPLTNISDDAFDNSAQTLNSLMILGAKFRDLPKAFRMLTNLTSLQIEDVPIQNWNDSLLEHVLANVTQVNLHNVNLTAWPSSLSSCHRLVNLDISYNPLKSVPNEAFLTFNRTLKELDLGNTGLTQIPMALFNLSILTSLRLSGMELNDSSDVEQLTFMPFIKHLIFINLDSSQLKTILNFSTFSNLTVISLDNNSISDASSGSFPSSLTQLYLRKNQLPSVPTSIANLTQLSSLYLSNNQIKRIEPGSLPTSLTRLDLSYNKITVITNTSFISMMNLSSLQLFSNPISVIDPMAFSDLVSLTHLNLGETLLTEVPLFVAKLPRNIDMFRYSSRPIPCPCPPPPELVDWLALSNNTLPFDFTCEGDISLELYLTTGCDPTTTTLKTVTSPGGATTLHCNMFFVLGSVLLLSVVFLLRPY